jgi:hypothetical protein
MSIEAHLAELERRHRALEAEIAAARAHPWIDDLEIVQLKRRKLLLKDEITRLQNFARRAKRSPANGDGARQQGSTRRHRQASSRSPGSRDAGDDMRST